MPSCVMWFLAESRWYGLGIQPSATWPDVRPFEFLMVIIAIGILAIANKPMVFDIHQAKAQAESCKEGLDERSLERE